MRTLTRSRRVRLTKLPFTISWLETTSISPEELTIRTARQVRSRTSPTLPSTCTQSPRRRESSKWKTTPARRLPRMS